MASKLETRRSERIKNYCDKHATAGNLTVAKLLHRDYPKDFITIEHARNAVRNYRGAIGSSKRKAAIRRGTLNQGFRTPPPLPKSFEEPWQKVQLDCKRLAVLSDIHIPYHDVKALSAILDFFDTWDPDAILLNGDLVDFFYISRFPKEAGRPTIKEELEQTRQFLKHLKHRFDVPIYYKLGNHDERFEKYIYESCPEIHEIATNIWRDICGATEFTTVIDNQAIIMAGKLPILHGHELRSGFASPVNPARGAFLQMKEPVMIGHYHQQGEHRERACVSSTISAAWSTGCLCGLSPKYARVNKWTQGAATVEIERSGKYHVKLRAIIDGQVM